MELNIINILVGIGAVVSACTGLMIALRSLAAVLSRIAAKTLPKWDDDLAGAIYNFSDKGINVLQRIQKLIKPFSLVKDNQHA